MIPMLALALLGAVFGAVIGSFLNVVIYRLPRGQSVVFPPSHCPHCDYQLGPTELIPIVSWIIQGGRCRHCKAPISARYPLIEALTALLFAGSAVLVLQPIHLIIVWIFIALLVTLSFIDINHYLLPDSLTYGGLLVGLAAALLVGFPAGFRQAAVAGAEAAGLLALIGGYGSLVARRGASGPQEYPVGYSQVYLAAAAGVFLGAWVGVGVGLAGVLANLLARRSLQLPDALPLGIALIALLVSTGAADPLARLAASFEGMAVSAGVMALLGGLYWALRFVPGDVDEEDDGVVLGFGDVKLAGMIGVWVGGFLNFIVALLLAVVLGSILGLIMGRRKLPFGPYLAIGGLLALFFGSGLLHAYLGWLSLK